MGSLRNAQPLGEGAAASERQALVGQPGDEEKAEVAPKSSDDSPMPSDEDESRFVTGKRLALIFIGLLSSVFLVQLDQTIVSTALPRIVSQFNALSQVTWVVTACHSPL